MNRINNSLISLVAIASGSDIAPATTSVLPHTTTTTVRPVIQKTLSTMTNSTDIITNSGQEKTKRVTEAAKILSESKIVCFDVDSTVIREEGIDELANYCGKGDEVKRLTKEAMQGSMTFQEALRRRLNIIRPSQKQIREFLKARPSTLSVGIKDLIDRLRSRNTEIYLISGGFDCLIEPIATELGIPVDHVFANKLLFYFNGDYAGFDTNQPTSHSGGKGEAITLIKKQSDVSGSVTMIGDGATDLEASPPADNFIGYGGNVVRDEVINRSVYYINDFVSITNQLK